MRLVARLLSKRQIHSAGAAIERRIPIQISEEIRQTIHDKTKPVVSLESTIITHGLPYPQNLSMATDVERAIRDNGAIPATCAFIDGIPHVGLTDEQLSQLSEQAAYKKINKVSRRDIGFTMANKQNGGTTIASTMILSHMAGIKVFATGGLGGVHKDGQYTMDVSADLTELGRTPVSVVCAGPKSILDIALTMEYLETQGVFVGTYNDDGREKVDVPGFYCRESGVASPYSFDSFKQAASIIYNQNGVMGLNSGNLLCIPPPVESALSSEFISEIISSANAEAKQKGVKGKELTPFLLSKIAQDTAGKSVECNIKFVLNNAKAASEIAKDLLKLENANMGETSVKSTFQPSTRLDVKKKSSASQIKQQQASSPHKPSGDIVDTVIIGSIALDTISSIATTNPTMNDSNPGKVHSSIGGVGYNVYLAHAYALQSPYVAQLNPSSSLNSCRLVTAVADDFAGQSLLSQLESKKVDTSGIYVAKQHEHAEATTAQYTSIHSGDGQLIVACADMNIIEQEFMVEHIKQQLTRSKPKQVLIDCNVSSKALNEVLEFVRDELDPSTKVVIEPTSAPKARKVSQVSTTNLQVFPNNTISLITPTAAELGTLHEAFSSRELFDDYDSWFPMLDSLGIDAQFRDRLTLMERKQPVMKYLTQNGILQQAFQMLPYIPNILVKLGAQGLVLISINKNIKDYKSIPTSSKYAPTFTITSQGRDYSDPTTNEPKQLGLVVQYFEVPSGNQNLDIKNVTGAGDSLIGFLTASLSSSISTSGDWLQGEIASVEQEWGKWEMLHRSQSASGLSLQFPGAISDQIKTIK